VLAPAELVAPVQEFAQPLEGPRAFDLFAPRLDDGHRAWGIHPIPHDSEFV